MAGMEGFEPPNAWTKTMCLTTWRHPTSPFILTKRANKIKDFIKIVLYVIIYTDYKIKPRRKEDDGKA